MASQSNVNYNKMMEELYGDPKPQRVRPPLHPPSVPKKINGIALKNKKGGKRSRRTRRRRV
jgi:hypothetical protein